MTCLYFYFSSFFFLLFYHKSPLMGGIRYYTVCVGITPDSFLYVNEKRFRCRTNILVVQSSHHWILWQWLPHRFTVSQARGARHVCQIGYSVIQCVYITVTTYSFHTDWMHSLKKYSIPLILSDTIQPHRELSCSKCLWLYTKQILRQCGDDDTRLKARCICGRVDFCEAIWGFSLGSAPFQKFPSSIIMPVSLM